MEQNFRTLDRAVREQIATFEGPKSGLLEEIFGQRDAIAGSDQGRSFRAFWNFLMSPTRQEELSSLLKTVLALGEVQELSPDPRLNRIHYDWLEAGEVAQRTVARLSEQLRRYLDDQAWLENRRIMQVLRGVEQQALQARSHPPEGIFMEIDEPAPALDLPMDRPLYAPPFRAKLSQQSVGAGDESLSAEALFEQEFVDKTRLASQIRWALQTRSQVTLAELVEHFPLDQGLAELLAYLSLATEAEGAVIDDVHKQELVWTSSAGASLRATMPLVVFSRPA